MPEFPAQGLGISAQGSDHPTAQTVQSVAQVAVAEELIDQAMVATPLCPAQIRQTADLLAVAVLLAHR